MEKVMRQLANEDLSIVREEKSRDELLKMFHDNPFKIDKIRDNVPEGSGSSVYRQGNFTDFCTGPHVPSTSYLKNVKLLSLASTNYKGDEGREKLVRIYGTVFPTEKELKDYLRMREEAVKRDHRKVGQEMDLFVFNSERAPGFPLYTPNGTVIKNELVAFMRELNERNGWEEVSTPHIFTDTMWRQSGHYAKYKDNMYTFEFKDGTGYAVKPMNCPGHITIFEREPHSYRDLPVKYSEPGQVYRYEKSGEVGGLTRPRTFMIDDGHGFMRPDQLVEEIKSLIAMTRETFMLLGESKLDFELSVMDEEHLENYLISYVCGKCVTVFHARKVSSEGELQCPECGSLDIKPDLSKWREATDSLRTALKESGIVYEELKGEAAFYGPKIDVHVADAIGRKWQCSTIQVDFMMPVNFNLQYVNQAGKKENLVMLHRAVFGSYERFMAILIENFAGNLPTWISPMQVFIAPVSEKFVDYSEKVLAKLRKSGLRAHLDRGSETLNKKLKMVREKRPSYIVVIGERELQSEKITVRNRKNEQKEITIPEFVDAISKEIRQRSPTQSI
ncbi:threonine--tRNA ligase [mine drainage metagenome]|uniref:threonine--tRNA ligase n=2 Tax=mine drainage metagenome TaxID=410659 RepID=T1A3A4_9ZZZZ